MECLGNIGTYKYKKYNITWVQFPKEIISLQFNGPKVLPSASDKAKLCAENFSRNSNLDDSDMSLNVFPSRTNLKRHNFSVTPKLLKRS